MDLTPEQENKIRKYVDAQGFKINTLRDDIIDHLCCVMEDKLGEDVSFEKLLHREVQNLAPGGLIELEREALFSLNVKRIILMKKLMYLIGFLGAVALTGGITFKMLHLPGGNELFMTGFIVLFLLFIPLVAVDRYKIAISRALSERLKIILGATAAVLCGLSGVFKMLHLQGAPWLLILGTTVFAIGYLPFFFITMYKKSIP